MEIRQKRWRLLAAAMLLALCSGIGYSWSVFQKPLMDLFAADNDSADSRSGRVQVFLGYGEAFAGCKPGHSEE